uniref:Uncharacterized protein n=1 Tax=Sphaerodactylus townsendi TaxID=933632 RepID=A0ACB8F0C8_9SAUR
MWPSGDLFMKHYALDLLERLWFSLGSSDVILSSLPTKAFHQLKKITKLKVETSKEDTGARGPDGPIGELGSRGAKVSGTPRCSMFPRTLGNIGEDFRAPVNLLDWTVGQTGPPGKSGPDGLQGKTGEMGEAGPRGFPVDEHLLCLETVPSLRLWNIQGSKAFSTEDPGELLLVNILEAKLCAPIA